jgi:putative transcriptional regulator
VHESVRGRLLVATPPLLDPNFVRSVVLMLEHTEEGALGVVLNRPTTTPLSEVLPAWGDLAAPPGVVLVGGPVQPDGMIGLAAVHPGDDHPGVRELWPGLGTVDLDAPPEIVKPGIGALRCFVGYAGWGPGQLEGEIAIGSWFVLDHLASDIWTPEPETLWRAVLRRQPPRIAQYALCPLDPSTN